MIENLMVMLIDLINKDKITARQMAAKLEVSVRTVYRYMDMLSLANVPVYAQKGRGGGIMLGQEFKLGAMYLTKEELDCAVAGLQNLSASADIRTAESAMNKLCALKNKPASPSSPYYNEHFVVDNRDTHGTVGLQDKINSIIDAKNKKIAVTIHYHDFNGDVTVRTVEPYSIVYHDNTWYAYCFCRLRKEMRLFKISRITHISFTDSIYTLQYHEGGWKFEFGEKPVNTEITLKVTPQARYEAEEWLGVENVSRSEDNVNFIASGTVPDDKTTYTRIIAMGKNVTVVSPQELKDKIALLCREALSQY